jgi:hypothetical protein
MSAATRRRRVTCSCAEARIQEIEHEEHTGRY